MEFGNRLKDLLKEKNISQETLARHIGVSQRAVSKWINLQSEPTESAIVNCAKFFEVSADFILGLSDT
ncbi:MAG: helix-turn-helix domain-containing protein [Clostridia bacterium]|nr:helix-turn-helix domain-containing protein [Clostridia bacterium]